MPNEQRLSEEEFAGLLKALKRHAETDLDQWAEWKIESARGPIFITVSVAPLTSEEHYVDVTHLLDDQ